MNHTDIKLLKQLSERHIQAPSAESTNRILAAAEHRSRVQNKPPRKKPASSDWLVNTEVWGQAASALMSVLFTLGVFLALNHSLTPNAYDRSVAGESTPQFSFKLERHQPRQNTLLSGIDIPKPERDLYSSGSSITSLTALTQPATDLLIDSQIHTSHEDLALSQALIEIAMSDIAQHLQQGRIHDARMRYEALKRTCEPCLLPASLEALAYLTEPHGQSG